MKHSLSLMLLVALLATSCSKSSNPTTEEPTTKRPTVLLSKVTNQTQGSQDYGKIIAEFTYNGKQLSKALIYHFSTPTIIETDNFIYNTQGQLTNVTGTYSNGLNPTNAVISYSGNYPYKVIITKGSITYENTLTYENGRLVRWFNPRDVDMVYTYDSNGHNTKQVAKEFVNGSANGNVYTYNYLTFDDKHNLTDALPIWVFFRVGSGEESLSYIPGLNNAVTGNETGVNTTYGYEYNSAGYVTKMSYSNGRKQSYAYEYITVN